MQLKLKMNNPHTADFDLQIRAKGLLLAALYWGNEEGKLPGWSAIAYVPIEPSGSGSFQFSGNRSVPEGVTRLYARGISPDFETVEEAYAEIPTEYQAVPLAESPVAAFTVMSDIHLSGKPWTARQALHNAKQNVILIPGDLTNDGFTEQFHLFEEAIACAAPEKLILSVTGNHDQLRTPCENYDGYAAFQERLLHRAEDMGCRLEYDPDGAYAALVNGVDVIGLQCVVEGRRFSMSKMQLTWLEEHLNHSDRWHFILCHAPLLAHNPHRNDGAPYFGRAGELQRIINAHGNIILISGHTHTSPNMLRNTVEYDAENKVIYIDDGSVAPTELCGEALMPKEWKDGVITDVELFKDYIRITSESAASGVRFPRGYYAIALQHKT